MLSRHLRFVKAMYSNLQTFKSLEQMRQHLTFHKYPFVMVYFRANWNPQCVQSDQDVQKFVGNNAGIHVIRIDSDEAPKIAKNYGVKAEPEFVFCLYGTEIIRQIGPDYQLLQDKLQKISNYANSDMFGGIQTKWLPYEAKFKAYEESTLNELYQRYVNDI